MIYVTSNKDHFCLYCPYAKFIGDRFFCPFVEGTCYKIPSTLVNPNPEIVDNFMKDKGYIRINDNEGRKLQ